MLNRKSARIYFNVGLHVLQLGFFIDLMFIFDTDVPHIDAMLKRGLHIAPNTNATRNSTFTEKNTNNKVI